MNINRLSEIMERNLAIEALNYVESSDDYIELENAILGGEF